MQFLSVESEAVGIIAIGARARGVIAIGQSAEGVVAIGQVALGVVAVGQLARGVIVVGQLGVGGWAWGQAAVGLVRAMGMVALAARARGLLPLSYWPSPPRRDRAEPELIPWSRLTAGAASIGWVAARLSCTSAGVELLVDGAPTTGVAIAPDLALAAQSRGTSDAIVLVRAEEVIEGSDDGGFRDAPSRRVRLTAIEAVWPHRWSSGEKIGAAVGLAFVLPLLAWATVIPLAQSLMALAAQ